MNAMPLTIEPVKMPFSDSERYLFTFAGFARHIGAINIGRKRENWREDIGFDAHVRGVWGEAALARYKDRYYCPLIGSTDTHLGDVANRYNVKTVMISNEALKVRPHDPPGFYYVLVRIELPANAWLVGWIDGQAARQTEWWKEPSSLKPQVQKGWHVPQSALKDMRELP